MGDHKRDFKTAEGDLVMKKMIVLMVGLVFCVAAVPAGAATIDFTNVIWQDFTDTVGGVTVTLKSKSGNLTWNNEDGKDNDGDGIGITGGDNDEVSEGQVLKVTFSSAVTISGMGFLDLFQYGETSSNNNPHPEYVYWETSTGIMGSTYALNGESSTGASAEGAGKWNVSGLDLTGVTWIKFYLPKDMDKGDDGDHNFALASLTVSSPVPIPGAVWLLGSGLVGLVGLRRKFRSKR